MTTIRRSIAVRRHTHSSARRAQSGHVMITVTLCIVTLLAIAGLAIDVSYLEHVKRRMQTAADSAAIAGAQEIVRNKRDQITIAAWHDASQNGFANGTGNITVAVNTPPTFGFYAGDNDAVEVIITQPNQPFWFMRVISSSAATVAARAVAHLGAGEGCLIALSPSDRGAITFDGTADVNLDNCTVQVNSNDCNALVANGGAQVSADGFNVVGNCPGYRGDSTNYDPYPPTTGLLPAPDPLANLAAPALSPCLTFNPAVPTLSPGTYCGGINIPNGTYNFLPGDYIMNGGGLKIAGGNVTGTGVSFYLTGTTSGAPSTRYGPVDISGNASVHFSAPTEGTYAGILFYQDRSLNLQGSTYNSNITGGANSIFDGVMYFPTSNVVFTGNTGTTTPNTVIIAWTLKIAGTPTFSGTFANMPGGSPAKIAVLGE